MKTNRFWNGKTTAARMLLVVGTAWLLAAFTQQAGAQCATCGLDVQYQSSEASVQPCNYWQDWNANSVYYWTNTVTESFSTVTYSNTNGAASMPKAANGGSVVFRSSFHWDPSPPGIIDVRYLTTITNYPSYNTTSSDPSGGDKSDQSYPISVAITETAGIVDYSSGLYGHALKPSSIEFTPLTSSGRSEEWYYKIDCKKYTNAISGGLQATPYTVFSNGPSTIVSATVLVTTNRAGWTPAIQTQTLSAEVNAESLAEHCLQAFCGYGGWGTGVVNQAGGCTNRDGAATAAYRHADASGAALGKIKYRIRYAVPVFQIQTLEWDEVTSLEGVASPPPTHRTLTVVGSGMLAYTDEYEILPPGQNGSISVGALHFGPPPGGTCTAGSSSLTPGSENNGFNGGFEANGGFDSSSSSSSSSSSESGNGGGNARSLALTTAGGPNISINLGNAIQGAAGYLLIQASVPSAALATPQTLQAIVANSVQVISGAGGLQQVRAQSVLVNITVQSSSAYTISLYHNAGTMNTGSGLWTNFSDLFSTWVISNQGDTNKLVVAGPTGTWTYQWITNGWQVAGPGDRTEVSTWNSGRTEQTFQIKSTGTGTLLYQEVSTYSTNASPLGTVITQKITGSGADTLTNKWFYYNDTNSPGNGRLYMSIGQSGFWQRFTYDTNGRTTKIVSQFQNGATNAAENVSRVREFDYAAVHTNDIGAQEPNVARTVVESLYGAIIARTYSILLPTEQWSVQCLATNAAWSDAGNLITITKSFGLTNGILASSKGPDGTVSISKSVTNSSGWTTNISYSGQPATGDTNIVDGTITTTISDPTNRTISSVTVAWPQNIVTDSQTYTNFDDFNRPQRTIYLDGSHSDVTYSDCCGFGSSTDQDGTTTTNIFDALNRLVLTKNLGTGIAYSNVFDAAGHVVKVVRIGSDSTAMTARTLGFDTAGRGKAGTNGVGDWSTTSYSRSGGYNLTTTTSPDGGTRIQKTFQDGSLYESSGTAVHPWRRNFYGAGMVDGVSGYAFTEVKLTNGVESGEWTRTYTDMAGRMAQSYSSSANPTTYDYNSLGQQSRVIDPDEVATRYLYNDKGEQEYVLNVRDDGGFTGTDRITRTVHVATNNTHGNVRAILVYAWMQDGVNQATEISRSEMSTDGLRSWNTSFGRASASATYRAGGGLRLSTNTAPDGTYSVATNLHGRLLSVTHRDTNGSVVAQMVYAYDAHGRQQFSTDLRSGTATNWFDQADRLISTATPVPSSGQSSQITSNLLDSAGRAWKTILPDGTSVTNEYAVTGALTKRTGSRTYPVANTFDEQGRMATLRTWQDYAGNGGSADTAWAYDGGSLSRKTYADSSHVDYDYTFAHRLSHRTWARGLQTAYSYSQNDVTGVDYSDGTPDESRAYDRNGRLRQSVRSGLTTNSFTYHAAGPVTSETQFGVVVTNRYDELLRRTNVAVVVGGTVVSSAGYGYDSAGRLATVTDGTNSATYSYLANSPLIAQIAFAKSGANRMTTSKSYDLLNRLSAITNLPSAAAAVSFAYAYNSANQRTAITNENSARWNFGYDALGQVTNGVKSWSDGTLVAGQQYGYLFDDIGNRKSAISGGDASGNFKRAQVYAANDLNQYTQRTVPSYLDVIGTATNAATVTVNGVTASRKSDYYRAEVPVANGSASLWQPLTNVAVLASGTNDYVTNWTGNAFVPQTPEKFTFDLDGNQTSDGRWTNRWDGENRLLSMTSHASGPSGSRLALACGYDSQSRRISKVVSNWTGSAWAKQSENRFVYDGWNLLAVLSESNTLQLSFRWGSDLSGSMQGAGGVGGLISMTVHNGALAGVYFYAYDGNGNVAALISAYDGTVVARYEYDPFGRTLRATGPLAFINPFRFSTKYCDDESGLLYYGYRYYDPSTGRWLSRDPIQETDGGNIYAFVRNAPTGRFDVAGLWGTDSHYDIITTWMDLKGQANGKNYYAYKWKCCIIPVAGLLRKGNDDVDGSDLRSIWAAQATRNANQHAMRVPFQPVAEAQAGYNSFINGERAQARAMAARARAIANTDPYGACRLIEDAVRAIGRAQHPIADSTSPAHAGFQAWLGPDIVGGSLGDAAALGPEVGMPAIMAGMFLTIFYEAYVNWHTFRERGSVYQANKTTAVSTVRGGVDGDLDNVLSE